MRTSSASTHETLSPEPSSIESSIFACEVRGDTWQCQWLRE